MHTSKSSGRGFDSPHLHHTQTVGHSDAQIEGLAAERIQLRFDGVPLPGYAWIFPTSATSANVGLGSFAVPPQWRWLVHPPAPKTQFASFVQTPAMQRLLGGARQVGPTKGYPLRTDFLDSPNYGERVLLVGEAAGLVNPLTGDGIDFALETGRTAAEHLATMLKQGNRWGVTAAAYDRHLREEFGALFRFCTFFQQWGVTNRSVLNTLIHTTEYKQSFKTDLINIVLGNVEVTTHPALHTLQMLVGAGA